MEQNPFTPDYDDLPQTLRVFPLSSAFLLPSGRLPLNIFEPRYLQMIDDALAGDRMIGMIQPEDEQEDTDKPALKSIGCAGKIVEFSETEDGRYMVTLSGVYRFKIDHELSTTKLYRTVQPSWDAFKDDHKAFNCLGLNRDKLKTLLKSFFKQQEMDCDWQAVDGAPDGKLITCLSMVCPFEKKEKQALLEAACCKTRAELFIAMLEMAVQSGTIPMNIKSH